MNMHPPREVAAPGAGRECGVCGRPVTGYGPELRHEGETFRATPPDPKDARAFDAALQEALSVARRLGDDTPPEQVARAIVETIYARDRLKRRPRAEVRRRRAAERAAAAVETRDITEPLHPLDLAGVA